MGFKVECPYKNINNNDNWYKGCLHSHTLTGGKKPDFPPKYAAFFLKHYKYDFLVITDHDYRADLFMWEDGDWDIGQEDFLLIKGLEVSQTLGHIGVIGCMSEISTAPSTEEQFIMDVSESGFPVVLNHPFKWRNQLDSLLESKIIDKIHAMEIYSGSRISGPQMTWLTDDIWDAILAEGKRIWAVASPDCHSFHTCMTDSPLNGFVMVCADELKESGIMAGIRNGCLYASCGVIVKKIEVTDEYYYVSSENATSIEFTGNGSKELQKVEGSEACYFFKGDEGYVRVKLYNDIPCFKMFSDFPQTAWLQPAFLL